VVVEIPRDLYFSAQSENYHQRLSSHMIGYLEYRVVEIFYPQHRTNDLSSTIKEKCQG
jgi:hypothetical protein